MSDENSYKETALNAKLSWIMPAIAWGSQIIIAVGRIRLSAVGSGAAALAQLALLILGAFFGICVLKLGRTNVPRGIRQEAMAGTVISVGTILLSVVLILILLLSPGER